MTPEEHLATCCVIKCLNTPKNSNVTFFSFPAVRCRSYQRNKWVQAIKNKNGRWWMPTLHSLVCSDHFVQGQPSTNPQDTDFVPSIFTNKRKGESIQSRAVSVKKFALEYIKHDALLEKPTRACAGTERKRAYQNLAAALGIPVTMVRSWERRFREYFEEKMADPPENRMPFADGKPHWLTTVANRLLANPIHRLTVRSSGGAVSPGGVVAALCAAAWARGTLCSTALYNDVRRVLRLSSAINDLHAIWVSAQRVSVQQVVVAGRAGDAAHAAPPPAAVEVADLVLLHTDVDILTEESVTLYEESAALHTLWQLIQRHRLEDAAPAHSRVRAQRWTRAHRSYLESGRKVSLVVLQRRWYELKEQARVRLSMHWRRPQAPQLFNDLTSAPDPTPEPAPDPAPTPHELYPRPAPLHIAILKRYPHIATREFRSWRQLVLEGTIVTEPLEEENDVTETQSNNEHSTGRTDTGDDAAVNKHYTNISNAEKPTFDEPKVEQPPDNNPLTAGPTYTNRLEENDVKETKSNINEHTTARTDTDVDSAAKQLYPNMSKVEEPTFDKSRNEQTFYSVPFVKQSTADDQLVEHTTDSDCLAEKPTVHEPKVEQPIDSGSLTDNHVAEQTTDSDLLVMQRTVDDPFPEQTTDTGLLAVQDPLPEQTTDTGLLHAQSTVDKSRNEQTFYSVPFVKQSTADDQLVEHTTDSDCLAEKPTVHEPKVEQPIDSGSLTDNHVAEQTTDSDLLVMQRTVDDPFPEQTTDTGLLAVQDPLPEQTTDTGLLHAQSTVDKSRNEQTFYSVPFVKQSTADDHLVEHTTDSDCLAEKPTVHEPKVEQPIDSGSLTDNHVAEQTTDSDLLVMQRTVDDPFPEQTTDTGLLAVQDPLPEQTTDTGLLHVQSTVDKSKIEQAMDYDFSIDQSTVFTLAEIPGGYASNAATADIQDMLDKLDTQGGGWSEQIHSAEDKSNEVLPPIRAYSSDTDTDTEDNLVIDECSNKTACSLKLEPVPHIETHSCDTLSPYVALQDSAETIEVLKMLDPNTVKTEILFESDEDDFESCNEVDKGKIELNATKKMSFINNRIIFVDEEPRVSCDVKSIGDVTERMDWEDEQEMDDLVNDTPTIDHKLLMDTKVQLFRIDKIRAWKNNVRKDNSIKVSRIHRRYYTPKHKYVCTNPKSRKQDKRWDVELRALARLATNNTTTYTTDSTAAAAAAAALAAATSTTTSETQEIRVDKSCLDKVAKTHSIRELCRNIKRELIEEQLALLEGDTPNKKAKIESDSDDDTPLLLLRERSPSRETTDETEQKIVREMVEESSSDDELLNNEMVNKQGEERKRGRGSYYAASTIEWSSAFAPALGRVAKRVSLPDIESVRRYNSGVQVAQVAPITNTVGANGDDAMQVGQPLADAAADNTPEAWRTLDLPADDELQAALDELTTAPVPEPGQQRTHCCAARRHREVNDSRRRIGLAEIPLHNHPEGECNCCCTHLSDADARLRLDQQLRALHQDIEQMLKKAAVGKIQSKAAQKNSRSPSPAQASTSATKTTAATSASKQAAKDAPSTTATVSKGPKAKPAANTNRRKRSRARPPPAPAPAPPAPLINDLEEWQRQKSMNAKYFHINSNFWSKKDKSTTTQDTAEQSTSAQGPAIQRTTARGHAVQSTITQRAAVQSTASRPTVIQSSLVNRTAVQSTAAKRTAVQSTTLQATAVQSITVQTTAVQITTALSTALQSTAANRTVVQSTTLQATTVQRTTAQERVVQSTSAQGTAVQSTASQATVVQSTTAQGRAAQSTSPQTAIQQRTIAQIATPTLNIVESGLMPYIRHSPLVSPPEEPPRVWHTVSVPSLHGLTPVAIAPKPAAMRHASLHAQQYSVVDEPAATKKITATKKPLAKKDSKKLSTNLYQSQVTGARRMNLTTEQVSETAQPVQVMTVNNGPTDTPMSILEEYSRTLIIEPVNNTPVVNALSLRVPGSGPQGPKTTIVMALTLPSDEVIKQTINSLYANDMVDLTEEPEAPESVVTNVPKQKTSPVDLVAAVKSLINPANKNSARSLVKSATTTESGRSLLKSTIMSAIDTFKPPATEVTRDVTPLSCKLHDGDVIEIDDSDSNHSNGSDGNQSGNSNKSSIFINKSSKPVVYSNKGTSQPKSVIVKESSDESTSRTDETSNQAASNGNEAVSKTNEGSSQASTKNSMNQTIDKDKSAKQPSRTKKPSNEGNKTKYGNAVFKKTNVSVDTVSSHSVSRPCSRIPVLTSLTDGSLRCPARFANVAALTDFMATLRKAAAQADKEVYCHKWSAVEQPVSALPCGGTLLCVDGSQPPLVLPTRDPRGANARRDRATPHARAHLVLTEADPPCALPTYWTLSAFGLMARVVPDEPPSTDAADGAGAAPRGSGAHWCPERGDWITPKEDRKICEKNHNFKILTAFCSADGIRQAARAGASLLLLSMQRARVVVLTLQRQEVRGVVRHRASADVEGSLLRELESLLDEAEIDEQLGGRADITDSETAGN